MQNWFKGISGVRDSVEDSVNDVRDYFSGGPIAMGIGGLAALYLGVTLAVGGYWSIEPDRFDVQEDAKLQAEAAGVKLVRGYTTANALHDVANTLLTKPGGYLSNDIAPPGLWLDNMPAWEYGVLVQVRDLSSALRKDFSRSQSQSTEDPDLVDAEPKFYFDNDKWMLPATEDEYRKGISGLERYMVRLADPADKKAQFYARADNLRNWLKGVESRLGSLSQRLSASVGQERLSTDEGSTGPGAGSNETVKTPWLEIDDVFYEARGQAWALSHFLHAIESDFGDVLDKKNARVSVRQIIRELEAAQEPLWSPMILNGTGFGILANHSLVMANYISRANAAIIDLRQLLEQG